MGEATGVVGKEMYTFPDRGEQITLRPEGTAGVVRSLIEHGLVTQVESSGCGTPDQCFATNVPRQGDSGNFTS